MQAGSEYGTVYAIYIPVKSLPKRWKFPFPCGMDRQRVIPRTLGGGWSDYRKTERHVLSDGMAVACHRDKP